MGLISSEQPYLDFYVECYISNALTCLSFSLWQEVHPSLAALTQSYIDHQFKEGLVLLSVGMILLFFTIKRLNLVRLE